MPVTLTSAFEKIAETYDGRVLRTKADPGALMLAATREGVILAGDGTGNYIVPQFQEAVDGMMAFAKLLEYLARHKARLSEILDEVPQYATANRDVPCPWDAKGKVMRLLNERYKEQKGRQIDGFRIELDSEWVLVLPDPDRPVCRLYVEGTSPDRAQQLLQEYSKVVESLASA